MRLAEQYQLFPALRVEEYEALKADIAKRGVLVPVEVDEKGEILDGHHRVRACMELGLTDWPTMPRIGLSEDQKREHILKINLLRRHLDNLSWAEAFARLLEVRGVERRPGPRNDKANSETVSLIAAELGVERRTAFNRLALLDLPDATKEKVRAKEIGEVEARRQGRQAQKAEAKAAHIAEIEAAPPALPTGPFDVIVIDPPWQYAGRSGDSTHRARNPYPDMSVEDICREPVADVAGEDCLLWLWTTNAFMHDAFHVLDAWGFQAKTILTWAKDRMGTGDWLRGQTEHAILAVRGRPVVRLTNQTTLLHGALREHSRKPDEFYRLVEELCPGSKVDWFSREPRDGWAQFGSETERFA